MASQYERTGKQFKSLAKSSYGQNRRTDAAFTDQETVDFLNGVFVSCRSSNVKEMAYIEDDQHLIVVFKAKGNQQEAIYQYFGISGELAEAFASAPSKGGATWDYLIRQAVSYHRVG